MPSIDTGVTRFELPIGAKVSTFEAALSRDPSHSVLKPSFEKLPGQRCVKRLLKQALQPPPSLPLRINIAPSYFLALPPEKVLS